MALPGVEDSPLSVGQDGDENAVCIAVVLQGQFLEDGVDVFQGHVVVDPDFKVEAPQGVVQVFPVLVCAVPGLQPQAGRKVFVVENEGYSAPPRKLTRRDISHLHAGD